MIAAAMGSRSAPWAKAPTGSQTSPALNDNVLLLMLCAYAQVEVQASVLCRQARDRPQGVLHRYGFDCSLEDLAQRTAGNLLEVVGRHFILVFVALARFRHDIVEAEHEPRALFCCTADGRTDVFDRRVAGDDEAGHLIVGDAGKWVLPLAGVAFSPGADLIVVEIFHRLEH